MDLFDLDELPTFLQLSAADTASAVLARRLATGWMNTNSGRNWADADEVPEEIHGWALELASLVYDNPRSMQSEAAGPYSYQKVARREQILAEVRQWREDQAAGANPRRAGTIFVTPGLRMRHPARWRGSGGW